MAYDLIFNQEPYIPTKTLPEQIQAKRNRRINPNVVYLEETAKYCEQMLDDFKQSINMQELAEIYIEGMTCDDQDKAEWTRKQLAIRMGDFRTPFTIVDERNGEAIFDLPGVAPSAPVGFYEPNVDLLTLGGLKYAQNNDSQQQLKSNLYDEEMYRMLGERSSQYSRVSKAYMLGWYEILDFLNRLSEEDSEMYGPIRKFRDEHDYRVFWAHELPMSEYIAKYGKPEYVGLPQIKVATSVTNAPQTQSTTLALSDEDYDTDDWE